ncbi:MAG: glycosyltransferase family 4 protein [Fimbriimonadaceae bacterium]|nr:glycosyltransferase family 4 protein [Fimbriimonadaceae bacterium]
MTAVRVIAFVPYPLGKTPSQRFRLEQWAPLLRADGFELVFRPFIGPDLARALYRQGAMFSKLLGLTRAALSLARNLPGPGEFDVAVVHRAMSLLGPASFERRLAGRLPLVYDFDDAIHRLHTSEANRTFGWLKLPGKTAEICRLAKAVVVGNEYLADFARAHSANVAIVPSSVDTMIYTPSQRQERQTPPVVGWMGSSTSQTYLEPFTPLLARIAAAGLIVRIISDRQPTTFSFPFEWRAWSADTEVGDLREFDLGIMPLPDTEWAKGKCAMKILQYMGVGVPSVGSPIGGNLEVIRDGQNGFLASAENEWLEKILRVIHDKELYRRIGAAGRDTVVKHYSASVCASRFGEVLRRVYSPGRGR